MSFANDQNWATSEMLKMPTQMKKATPTKGTRAATAPANSSMHATKKSVTPTMSLVRSTRDAISAVERHECHQQQRLPGRRVRADFGAAAQQDQAVREPS